MKKSLLLLMMLVAGLAAQATLQDAVKFRGRTITNGSNSFCVWSVESTWGADQQSLLPGSGYLFDDYVIHANNSPATISLNGRLNFQEGTSAADVITGSSFTVTVESSTLWFYGATVKTGSDATVTGCSVTTSSDKHTLTVTIPEGKTFGYIYVNYVPNEPFSSGNTVISGVEDEYLYSGTPIKPEPTVTYKNTVLTKGTDYTLSYSGSNNVGTATVTVTGTGEYAGDISKRYTLRDVDLRDFNSLGNNTYEIATTTDLDYLARYVKAGNYGNNCAGLTFLQTADIAYSYTTEWNNGGENNFTAVGIYSKPFMGTFDGQNHTISGIRIFKNGNTTNDESQGLFGYVGGGGTVKNVILSNTHICGFKNTGGIVGYNSGTIEDCRVESNVFIKAGRATTGVGGIAGICAFGGAINRCVFKGRAKFISFPSSDIGGIVGTLSKNCTVSNCLVLDAFISGDANYSGAIAGNKTGTLTANYYHNTKVISDVNNDYVNVGVGLEGGNEDQEGARSVHTLTLPSGVTATGETVTIDGVTYFAAATTVTLSYSGEVPEGYCLVSLTVMNGDTEVETTTGNNGTYTFVMPAADVAVTVTVLVGLHIDSVNFPDANFRNWLLSKNYGSDGMLTDEEIAGITSIYVKYKNIADLTGIEHFTALRMLDCGNNQLTALDVSHNTALTDLECGYNQLDTLDVSHNTALTWLYCHNNQLDTLDVSHNTALIDLECGYNQLDTLDVSHNTALTWLYCSNNQLTSLDVSHNTALTGLDCSNNQLDTLDVSHNTALTNLCCSNNQLTSLDVSHNTALTWLYCSNNQLTSLDVSHNTALITLWCHNNQINGESMEALVAGLPTVDVDDNWGNGVFHVIDLDSETEQNVITTTQVTTAKGKNWTVYGYTNGWWEEYDGSEPTYAISLPSSFEHGTVTCDKETAAEGETVTLTVTPDNGYELETLTVTTVDGNEPAETVEVTLGDDGTYSFVMPAADVEVTVVLAALLPGDINGDNVVDVSDVNIIINIILGKAQASTFPGISDLNNDNIVDVSDVNAVINIILGKIN